MTVSPFDSALLGPLVSDPEIAPLFSDAARLKAMLVVEAALARAEGRTGTIPAEAAARISEVALSFTPDPASLGPGTAGDGVPVPALVKALRQAVGAPHASSVHWGATSQDIVDTAFVLQALAILDILVARTQRILAGLARLADRHRATVMPGRTRYQQATPTTFGLSAAVWGAPLIRTLDRLAELRPRLALLSFGGASGNLSALGADALAVEAALAGELGLALPPVPWHANRDGIAELASVATLLTGALGKMGLDVLLLAQSEVAEIRVAGAGGSSTMPHKANPIASELLVTLARVTADQVGTLHHAMGHAFQRDGAAWLTEWLTLPALLTAAGASTRVALGLVDALDVRAEVARAHVTDAPALGLSEAVTFALAAHMPRAEAEMLVKAGVAAALKNGTALVAEVAARTDAPVDWAGLADPAAATGAAGAFVDRFLAAAAVLI